ncbi:sugar ABC transporter permease [Clostridia bacterium]|nr:sugar ABC transporter permease [Clostridia bacterium]
MNRIGRGKRTPQLSLHIMLLPAVILLLIFNYYPMTGLAMAFENYNPTKGWFSSPWVGLKYFKYVFSMPNFGQVMWNTITIALAKTALGLVVPITFALLLNEVRHTYFKRTIQTILYLPNFLSWVILGGIIFDIFSTNGIFNSIFGSVFGQTKFLSDPKAFPGLLVGTDVWKNFGFSTIIYLAALTNVRPDLYEAAAMDGAGRWRQTLHITLPGITPVITLMALLALGNVLNAGFEQVLVLLTAPVYSTGDIIDTVVYRIGVVQGNYSVSTAIGLFRSGISTVLVALSYYLAAKFANYRIF